jgi:hypothetical protein
VTEAGEEPRQKGGIHVPGLAGAVDHNRGIECQTEAAKELGIGARAQKLGWYSVFGRSKSFRIEVDRSRKVAFQIGEQVAPDVHDADPAFLLPSCELIRGHQSRWVGDRRGGGRTLRFTGGNGRACQAEACEQACQK